MTTPFSWDYYQVFDKCLCGSFISRHFGEVEVCRYCGRPSKYFKKVIGKFESRIIKRGLFKNREERLFVESPLSIR